MPGGMNLGGERAMSVVDPLLDLAERCEAATGPDLALNDAIARARSKWEGRLVWSGLSRPYTASLDAAMTLVPEGWERIETTSLNYTDGSVRHYAAVNFMQPSKAAAPSLALCAAALKARATQSSLSRPDGLRPLSQETAK